MKPALLPFVTFSFLLLTSSLPSAPQDNDRTNALTEKSIRSATLKKSVDNALAIYRNGGLRGFIPAPGSSMEGTESVYDWLVQDIAIDATGNPTNGNPLTAPRTRNFKIGDQLPYVMQNYPLADETSKLPGRRHHRFAIPYPSGFDQNNKPHPIVAGIRDMTPELRSSEYNTLGVRDLVSMVGVFPDYACYMGAYIPRKEGYSISIGAGYGTSTARGIARLAHPLFPNPVPKLNSLWYAAVLQKTMLVGEDDKTISQFPGNKPNTLAVQFVNGKRLMFTYGTRDTKTRPIDTVVAILGYNNVNDLGTAPVINNPSTQYERIYITRELGYATRWEMWDSDGGANKDEIIAKAQKAYANNNAGLPADLVGKYNDHFEVGPMIEDKKLGVYKHTETLTDPKTGEKETRTWYLVGAHDYTNLAPLPKLLNPYEAFHPKNLSPHYLKFFGVLPSKPKP